VNAINVYGVDNVAMGSYTRSGTARYGTPAELGNTKTTYTLARDRAATWTIDRRNLDESMMVMEAGKSLARQLREIIVPEIDVYRLAAIHTAAASQTATTAVTASNAYLMLLNAQAKLDDNKVPMTGRICFCTPAYYNFIKQDSTFIKASEIAQKMLINGQVGEIDGVKIVKVPTSYLPANNAFILCHPSATVGPKILEDYKIHDNPPGINGFLVEIREVYDAFVLTNKATACARHQIA
jgi:N4-gp56 family major capsid protein